MKFNFLAQGLTLHVGLIRLDKWDGAIDSSPAIVR